VVHASPDAPAVDVLVDGAKVVNAAPFKAATDYLVVDSGPRKVEVRAAGAAADVINATLTLDKDADRREHRLRYPDAGQPALQGRLGVPLGAGRQLPGPGHADWHEDGGHRQRHVALTAGQIIRTIVALDATGGGSPFGAKILADLN